MSIWYPYFHRLSFGDIFCRSGWLGKQSLPHNRKRLLRVLKTPTFHPFPCCQASMCRNGNWNRPVSWQWSFTQIKWYAVRPTWFHPNDSKYCYKPPGWAHNDQNKPSFAWTSSNKRSSDRRRVPIQNCVMILPFNMVNMCPYCLRKFCEVIKKLTPPWSPWPSPELQLHLMAEAQEAEVEPHYFSRHLFKRTKISASKFIFSVSSKVVCLPSSKKDLSLH